MQKRLSRETLSHFYIIETLKTDLPQFPCTYLSTLSLILTKCHKYIKMQEIHRFGREEVNQGPQ